MTLKLKSYEWQYRTNEDDKSEIYSWCLDDKSNSFLVRVTDYYPSLFLQLPNRSNNMGIIWSLDKITQINKWIKNLTRENSPITSCHCKKEKLYYHKKNKYSDFLELTFRNEEQMRKFNLKFSSKKFIVKLDNVDYTGLEFRIYENNVNTVRKFLTSINLKHCDWFTLKKFQKVQNEDKISCLDNEFYFSYKDIVKIEDNVTITKPKILIYDIECYTDNHKAIPNALYSKHVVTMISVIYQVTGDISTRRRFLLTFSQIKDFEGTTIIKSDNEIDMLKSFAQLIIDLDPDIITGYNIFGFDFKYIIDRMTIKKEKWPVMGRILNKYATQKDIEWSSGAYGIQFMTYLDMPGRMVLDMMKIIKREMKYDNYDLGSVSTELLGKTKHDISAKEMFIIYEQLIKAKSKDEVEAAVNNMTRVAKYCIQDSELVIDLFEKTNTWIGLTELSNIVGVNMFDLFTRGQQVRCISQMYDNAHKKNIILETRDLQVKGFKGALVCEPETGIHPRTMCLDFQSLYPSIIMAFNLCFTTLIPENQIDFYDPSEYETIECDEIENYEEESDDESDDDNPFKEKKKIRKEDQVIIKKKYYFWKGEKGVLPSMVEELVSQRRAVRGLQKSLVEETLEWLILEKRQLALKVSANSIFGFLGTKKGLYPLPEVASSITSKGRQLILKCYDYLRTNYNAKIIYGDTDSVMFSVPTIKTNEETIEFGYKMQEEVSSLFKKPLFTEFEKCGTMLCMMKKKYVFWTIDKKTAQLSTKTKYLVKKDGVQYDIKEFFEQYPLEMFDGLWESNPKRLKRTETINFENYELTKIVTLDMMKKGIVPSRRDNCRWQREFYMKIMDEVMEISSFKDVYEIIVTDCLRFLRGEISYRDLIIIKSLGQKYKKENTPMKIFSDELKKIGKPPSPGDRLEYLIVLTNDEKNGQIVKTGLKFRDPQSYILGDEHIDYTYYVERFIKNNIQQFFQICYKREIEEAKEKQLLYTNCQKRKEFERFLYGVIDCIKTKQQRTQFDEVIKRSSTGEIIDGLIKIRGIGTKVKQMKMLYISKYDYFPCHDGQEPIGDLLKLHKARMMYHKELLMKLKSPISH
jgi:DNA polymerase elongation subunit (family B)